MSVKIEWNGNQFAEHCQDLLGKNLEKAAIHLTNKIKENINRAQPYKRYVGETVSYKGEDPSLPGEFPKVITGQLKRSITWEKVDNETVRVGTNLEYGRHLELGTKNMAARPFLRSTLIMEQKTLEKIIGNQ